MADKPTVHLTLAKLKESTKAPEPFILGLDGGKRVTFPDFYNGMDSEASEALLNELNNPQRAGVWPALKLWLSDGDLEKLRAQKFTLHQLMQIIAAANDHYERHYGTPGEGGGSDA
ncbi:hypothetical protein [Micrococcus sp. TA1]|uniref:hypothetical protein n=1 Tax=Micrococcus sp. TA1 TaxID=681627 RepID=UPI001620E982|nr:hypothetical protein [Micrococcus sp. TA1]MBB5748534.1 hypothetical protein [Micrococcus sp. TA1]